MSISRTRCFRLGVSERIALEATASIADRSLWLHPQFTPFASKARLNRDVAFAFGFSCSLAVAFG